MAGRRAKGEGTIKKRTDGRWVAQLTFPDGSRPSVYAASKTAAAAELAKLRKRAAAGQSARSSRQSVQDFLVEWMDTVVRPNRRPLTVVGYTTSCKHLAMHLGQVRLCDLRPAHIQRAYATLGARLSPNTVLAIHRVLHRALRTAVDWDLIPTNPADRVELAKPEPARRDVLTPDACRKLLTAMRDDPGYPLLVVLLTTGMRIGEVLGLPWSSVDLEAGTLSVRQQLQRTTATGYILTPPKSRSGFRTIYIPEVTRQALSEQRARSVPGEWGLVFTRSDGRPLELKAAQRCLSRGLVMIGERRFTLHELRHTVLTHLLASGMYPRAVADMAGHATVGITMSTYGHVLPRMHQDAAQRLGDLMSVETAQK